MNNDAMNKVAAKTSKSSDDPENPLMALVDAATSVLEKPLSKEPVEEGTASESRDDKEPASTSSPFQDPKKPSFAEHLMAVLDDDANKDYLVWMPDGDAFTIVNPKKFTLEAMPRLFSIRNMSSFVRKLGRWGFHRVHEKETRNSDIFKHKDFRRGDWKQCSKIRCVGRPCPSRPAAPVPAPTKTAPATATAVNKLNVLRYPAVPTMKYPSLPPRETSSFYLDQAIRRAAPEARATTFATSSVTSDLVTAALNTLGREEDPILQAIHHRIANPVFVGNPGLVSLATGLAKPLSLDQQILAAAIAGNTSLPTSAVNPLQLTHGGAWANGNYSFLG